MSACLGGCGALVGEGQKCHACAEAAVDSWLDRLKAQEPLTWWWHVHQLGIRLTAEEQRAAGGRDRRKRRVQP